MAGDSRKQKVLAVLMSVLMHAAVLTVLRQMPRAEIAGSASESPEPVSFEVVHQSNEPVAPPIAVKPARSTLKQKKYEGEVNHEAPPPSGDDSAARAQTDVPLAENPAPSLLPEGYVQPGQHFRGTTVYPNETQNDPREESAKAGLRAAERVQGWAEDSLAEARAHGGGSPYHDALRAALDGELQSSDAGTPHALGVNDGNAGIKHAYRVAAETYGRTGNPGHAPPGAAPTTSEKLAGRDPISAHAFARGSESPEALLARASAQAVETRDALAAGAPLLSLKFELRQNPRGELLSTELLESSGNLRFDAFVLGSVPRTLKLVTVPDPPIPKNIRSVFQVDGWLPKPSTVADEIFDASTLGIVKPFVDQIFVRSSAQTRFIFRSKLLRVY